jgi:hypothetical protein
VDRQNIVQVGKQPLDEVLGHVGGIEQRPEEETLENLQVSDVTAFSLKKF